MFDMMDLNAEIAKAKNTLGAADDVFQRHALRFDNDVYDDDEKFSLAQRLDRARRVAAQELPDNKANNVKYMKLVPVEKPPGDIVPVQRRSRQNSLVDNPYVDEPKPRKRSYSKRKKSVSF